MIDIICRCGHSHYESRVAFGGKHSTRTSMCLAMVFNENDGERYCSCNKYVPDNLLHIENLAKQRNLV
jgi:hypothetical protein